MAIVVGEVGANSTECSLLYDNHNLEYALYDVFEACFDNLFERM